ncbi:hypothetical protein CBR_g29370 [Chara braunii]|uniref:pyruvate decarboxylase n=1 Tax=Chara braunii TaxID=69332 RepID=A0A388JWI0_CHABU|nr:hypothetical protein CBR_g29370 [Chara braunii]|eukprot:GBG62171.1 hypothetical protein CBR_g29370 [Chara braunii]
MATGATSDGLAFGPVNGADDSSWSGIPACEMVEKPSTTQHEGSNTCVTSSCPITSSRLCTVGMYLSARLAEVGIEHLFAVAGDFNMPLLDEIVKNKRVSLISCCNELNAGYAADGYARARRAAAMCTTFNVGTLSALNAVAGAYAHDLPLICIAGNPSSLEIGTRKFIHHSLKSGYDLSQRRIYRETTADSVAIEHAETAPMLIDRAIASAIHHCKPVLIEVCVNISTALVPAPTRLPVIINKTPPSNMLLVEMAVNATVALLKGAENPVVVVGPQVRAAEAEEATMNLVHMLGCSAAVMADARGLFPEDHPAYIGVYMGKVGFPSTCVERVEAADAVIFVGTEFSDLITCGYNLHVKWEKAVQVGIDRLKLPSQDFGAIYMKDFIQALAEAVNSKDYNSRQRCWHSENKMATRESVTSFLSNGGIANGFGESANGNYSGIANGDGKAAKGEIAKGVNAGGETVNGDNAIANCISGCVASLGVAAAASTCNADGGGLPHPTTSTIKLNGTNLISNDKDGIICPLSVYQMDRRLAGEPLTLAAVQSTVQRILTKETTVIVDWGDSLFTALKLNLPGGARMEIQSKYASIGWSLGATLGFALGKKGSRTITLIGDGAFQMTAQEMSTMIRYNVPAIIFVLNNGWYMIEECIHPNPLYNQIQQWDYYKLVDVFNGTSSSSKGKSQGFRVTCEEELEGAMRSALVEGDGVKLIDCRIDKEAFSEDLLFFCQTMSAYGMRKENTKLTL